LNQDPVLYESKNDECGVYACLSYCWGQTSTFTSTLSTLQTRKRGFRLEDLPRTLRDAIIAARTLGIEYIWIDQLCIIQDSQVDWEVEAANMSFIYENAYITFAALDSPNTKTGLFVSKEDRVDIGGVALEVPLPQHGTTGKVYVCRATKSRRHGFMHRPERKESYGEIDALHCRLWTFQETALSRRILWFGESELGWSCAEATACECQPIKPSLRGQYSTRISPWLTLGIWTAEEFYRMEPLYLWDMIVEEASRRQTTYHKDLLPAISGLATKLGGRMNGRYFAGLWEHQIESSLLWWHHEQDRLLYEITSPIDRNYAPSWSWASTKGPVIPGRKAESCVLWTVENIDFSATTPNIYGPGRGVLTLKGVLVPLLIDSEVEGDFSFLMATGHDADTGGLDITQAMRCSMDHRHTNADRASRLALARKNLYFAFGTYHYYLLNTTVWYVDGLLLEKLGSQDNVEASLRTDALAEDMHSQKSQQSGYEHDDTAGMYRRLGHLSMRAMQTDKEKDKQSELLQWVQRNSKIFHIC
jgi:hypothetical protein